MVISATMVISCKYVYTPPQYLYTYAHAYIHIHTYIKKEYYCVVGY